MAAIKKEETLQRASGGLFVVLEGIDGSGKTTAWQFLKDHYSSDPSVLFLREPTNLPTGRKLRACLQGKEPPPDTDEGWMDLFLADRQANVTENIIPALAEGQLIVQDRYTFSTAAYQSASPDSARQVLAKQKHFPAPDVIIYLDLKPEQALTRIDRRSGIEGREHFESRQRLERIYANYQSILPDNCLRVNASNSQEEVRNQVLAIIESARRNQ